jgi:hypothetical protein
MIILVCGSRHAMEVDHRQNYRNVLKEYMALWKGSYSAELLILHGDCEGVDRMAGEAARAVGIGVVEVAANWTFYGKKAGPIRNRWMLRLQPDQVVGFHHDFENAKGTTDMLTAAKKVKILVSMVKV